MSTDQPTGAQAPVIPLNPTTAAPPPSDRDRLQAVITGLISSLEHDPDPETAGVLADTTCALKALTDLSRYTGARVDRSTLTAWSELVLQTAEYLAINQPDDLPVSRLDLILAGEKMRRLAAA